MYSLLHYSFLIQCLPLTYILWVTKTHTYYENAYCGLKNQWEKWNTIVRQPPRLTYQNLSVLKATLYYFTLAQINFHCFLPFSMLVLLDLIQSLLKCFLFFVLSTITLTFIFKLIFQFLELLGGHTTKCFQETHILLHCPHPWFGLGNNREHVSNPFLLEGVVPLQYPFVQPLGVSHSRHWVLNALLE